MLEFNSTYDILPNNCETYKDNLGFEYTIDNRILVSAPSDNSSLEIEIYSIPEGVKIIHKYAFKRIKCTIKKLILPNSLICLGIQSLRSSRIKEIEIPSSVIEIGDGAVSSLTKIFSNSTRYIISNGLLVDTKKSALLCVFDYKNDLEIPESICEISTYSLFTTNNLHSLTLPSSIEYINENSISVQVEEILFKGVPKKISYNSFTKIFINSVKRIIIPNGSIKYFTKHLTDWVGESLPGNLKNNTPSVLVDRLIESQDFSSSIDKDMLNEGQKKKEDINVRITDVPSYDLSGIFRNSRQSSVKVAAPITAKPQIPTGSKADIIVKRYFDLVNRSLSNPKEEFRIPFFQRFGQSLPATMLVYGQLKFPNIGKNGVYIGRWAESGVRMLDDKFYRYHYDDFKKVFERFISNDEFVAMLFQYKESRFYDKSNRNKHEIYEIVQSLKLDEIPEE